MRTTAQLVFRAVGAVEGLFFCLEALDSNLAATSLHFKLQVKPVPRFHKMIWYDAFHALAKKESNGLFKNFKKFIHFLHAGKGQLIRIGAP